MIPRLLFAAAASSAGKSTLARLFASWARGQGLKPSAFKCGPDFIDAQHLGKAAGRPAWNLDAWMTGGAKGLRRSFALGSQRSGIAVAEGVMGLFDGKRGEAFGRFSTAETAQELAMPLLVVLNARKAGVTLATQLLGLQKAGPRLRFAGAVLNECSGPRHYALIAPAVKKLCGLPVFGWLPRMKELELAERHLGLTPPSESPPLPPGALSKALETIDFKALLKAAQSAGKLALPSLRKPKPPKARVRLGLARDHAFHFYYEENLRLFEEAGAELVPFSPLNDRFLPEGLHGLLLGGGFPEMFGEALQKNEFLRREIGAKVLEGFPVWAECGGLMYLCASLSDLNGKRWQMAGALAADVLMTRKLQDFGYAQARALKDSPALKKGASLRGHEFHHSQLFWRGKPAGAWSLEQAGKPARPEGFLLKRGVATYLHAHLASQPGAASRFVEACRRP